MSAQIDYVSAGKSLPIC